MLRVAAVFLIALLAGAGLTGLSLLTGLPLGWVGAAGLIGWSWRERRRWRRLEAEGGDPGAPERIVWQRFVATALIGGQIVAALLSPVDIHLGRGNWLAIDCWTLAAGQLAASVLFREDPRHRDERDDAITALGRRTGFNTLIGLLVALLLWLGFAPVPWTEGLTHFLLGNILIVLIMASLLAQQAAQLVAYAPDSRDGG